MPFVALSAKGFDRAKPLSLFSSSAVLLKSTMTAIGLVSRQKPDVVVGFGGYVSIPVGLAAAIRGVPLVIHEQNSIPGLANRILARFARTIAVTYEGSTTKFPASGRTVLTGNPVRREILLAARDRARERLGVDRDALLLLVVGGSRGARHINEAMVELYPRLRTIARLRVIHVAGRIEAASVAERIATQRKRTDDFYRVLDYVEDMGSALAAADLVVSRAGATSLAEITALGRAAVLVPYPYATDDHQTVNASYLARSGGAVVVPDSELDGATFGDTILRLLMDGDRLDRMSKASAALGQPNATRELIGVVREAAMARDRRTGS